MTSLKACAFVRRAVGPLPRLTPDRLSADRGGRATLSDREVVLALRPYGQGVQGAPINPPLSTNNAPALATAAGALGERVFGAESTR